MRSSKQAEPKSMTLQLVPTALSSSTFSGFRSQWMMLAFRVSQRHSKICSTAHDQCDGAWSNVQTWEKECSLGKTHSGGRAD